MHQIFQIRLIIIQNTFLIHDTKIAPEKMFILAYSYISACFSWYKQWLNLFLLSLNNLHKIFHLKKKQKNIKEVGHYAVLFFLRFPTNPECCWLGRGGG